MKEKQGMALLFQMDFLKIVNSLPCPIDVSDLTERMELMQTFTDSELSYFAFFSIYKYSLFLSLPSLSWHPLSILLCTD